jgi:hypothetical protein
VYQGTNLKLPLQVPLQVWFNRSNSLYVFDKQKMQQAMYRPQAIRLLFNYCCLQLLQTFYFQNILKVALTMKALEISNATGNSLIYL